jgi:hypothetical protein
MKKIIMVGVAVSSLLYTGCKTMEGNLRSEKNVNVIIEPSADYQITRVSAYQEGDEIAISGTLRPRFRPARKGGHVDIRILDSAGSLLEKLKADPHQETSHKQNMGGRKGMSRTRSISELMFHATSDLDVPEGAEIRLRYHSSSIQQCKE